jgi:hypothetical protein
VKQAASGSRPSISCVWGVLCFALSVHCTSIERATRVAITLDAGPELRGRIAHIDLAFYGAGGQGPWRMRTQDRLRPDDERSWPISWSFARSDTRDARYSLEAKALDKDGEALAELRAVGSFREQETVQLPLLFDDSCKEACGEGRTCRDGACIAAELSTETSTQTGAAMGGNAAAAVSDGGKPSGSSSGDACSGDSCDDPCGPDHGSCDPAVRCILEQGKPRCAECQGGFSQGSDGSCSALLTGLEVAGATLIPSFRPEQSTYTLRTGLIAGQWKLTPTTLDGAELTIEGQPWAADKAVTSQLTAASDGRLELEVAGPDAEPRKYVFELQAGGEQLAIVKAKVPFKDAHFGHRIALDETRLAVSADAESSKPGEPPRGQPPAPGPYQSGAAHTFVRDASGWQPESWLKGLDTEGLPSADAMFGKGMAMLGDTLAVGAWQEDDRGATYVFERDASDWVFRSKLTAEQDGANFGQSVAIRGDTVYVGASSYDLEGTNDSGAVFVYKMDLAEQAWKLDRTLRPDRLIANSWFGSNIVVSDDFVVVGATGEGNGSLASGTAYVFRTDTLEQIAELRPSTAAAAGFFGERAAISGNTIAVCSFNNNAGLSGGTVYVFTRSASGSFEQEAVLQASNASAGDQFGFSVALHDDYLLVGAPHESSGARGINGSLSGSLSNSGAAYLFARSPAGSFSQVAHIKATEPADGAQFGYDVAMSGSEIAVSADCDSSVAQCSGAVFMFR